MVWDTETQRRFDRLRERKRNGELSAAEQHALDALLAALDAEEAGYLAPAIARMDQELHQAEAQLAALRIHNEELAALAHRTREPGRSELVAEGAGDHIGLDISPSAILQVWLFHTRGRMQ